MAKPSHRTKNSDAAVNQREGEDLGRAIILAMKDWAGDTPYDPRVPLIGLFSALLGCLNQLPETQKKLLARDFADALLKDVGLPTSRVS